MATKVARKLTKIVCTIGPSTESEAVLKKLHQSGMNIARFNFKHGEYEWYQEVFKRLHRAAESNGTPVAMMLDLQGPDIRTGKLVGGKPVMLKAGDPFFLTSEKILGSAAGVSISINKLDRFMLKGDHVLINDGAISMKVLKSSPTKVACEIVNGAELGERKGINIPGKRPAIKALTAKDENDIAFGLKNHIDFIALSFVQSAQDVVDLRKLLKKSSEPAAKYVQVISKIESVGGLAHFDEILEVSDAIMIARGDMGIELPMEQIPSIQKRMIKKCNAAGKPVITATQLLESMTKNPIPTRAETTDVANAVLDNTDAVMLSGETANGKYPVEAVRMMTRIIQHTEKLLLTGELEYNSLVSTPIIPGNAVAMAACELAEAVDAKCIMTMTISGKTARAVANFRPTVPIVVATPYRHISHQLLLVNCIEPDIVYVKLNKTFRSMIDEAIAALSKKSRFKQGDRIVITAGISETLEPGHTNLVMVHTFE